MVNFISAYYKHAQCYTIGSVKLLLHCFNGPINSTGHSSFMEATHAKPDVSKPFNYIVTEKLSI